MSNFQFSAPQRESQTPETTGRYIIVFNDQMLDKPDQACRSLGNIAGIRHMCSTADFKNSAVDFGKIGDQGVYFPSLGIASVSADVSQYRSLQSMSGGDDILAIEPEGFMYAVSGNPFDQHVYSNRDGILGYRDTISNLYDSYIEKHTSSGGTPKQEESQVETLATYLDTKKFTWGLQATRVDTSKYNGNGIRVAILDTGIDFKHPDFSERAITSASFCLGETAQDTQGHGTHCTGTACGPRYSAMKVKRYGCACEADIFIGKVLDDNGRGADGAILNGIEWAIKNRCQIISGSTTESVGKNDLE